MASDPMEKLDDALAKLAEAHAAAGEASRRALIWRHELQVSLDETRAERDRLAASARTASTGIRLVLRLKAERDDLLACVREAEAGQGRAEAALDEARAERDRLKAALGEVSLAKQGAEYSEGCMLADLKEAEAERDRLKAESLERDETEASLSSIIVELTAERDRLVAALAEASGVVGFLLKNIMDVSEHPEELKDRAQVRRFIDSFDKQRDGWRNLLTGAREA